MFAILSNADVLAFLSSISSITFWIAFFILNFILLVSSTSEFHITKFILLVALVAILWTSIIKFTVPLIIVFVAAYFLLGFLYSMFKWYNYIKTIVKENSKLLSKFKINNIFKINVYYNKLSSSNEKDVIFFCKEIGIPESEIDTCVSSRHVDANKLRVIESDIKPSNNTDLFYTWIVYWPWTIVKDITFNIGKQLFEYTKECYTHLVNKILTNNLQQ